MQGEKILLDLIRRIGILQEGLAQMKSQLARAEKGPPLKDKACETLRGTSAESLVESSLTSTIVLSRRW